MTGALRRLVSVPSGLRGVVAMIVAMALFVTNDTCVKLSMRELPLGESLGVRSIISSLLLLALLIRNGEVRALPLAFRPLVLARSGLDALTTLAYVAALAVMPIASSSTIFLAAPLMTTALAVPMLGEKVGWRSWTAVLVGFCGAIIVTRPDPSTFSAVALLPLAAAFFSSVRDISTRNISMEIPGGVVAFSAAFVLALSGCALAVGEEWRVPSLLSLAYVTAAALAFACGTLALVYAFRHAPVATLSPLRYLLVFGATISGVFVFGELPDSWTAAGMVLVVSSGLYALHRERVRSRRERAAREGEAGERDARESGCVGAALAPPAVAAPPND